MSRLPSVGGDDGNWGVVLNDFLLRSHNSDGTLKSDIYGMSNLKDVQLTSLQNTQYLAYNSVTTKWKNKTLYQGGTPLSIEELEPVKAIMIGNALGYEGLPEFDVTLGSTQDSATNLTVVEAITAVENGALVVDGYAAQVGDRIAFWDNVSYADHLSAGIYTVTNKGSTLSKFVLTRSQDTRLARYWIAPVLHSEKYGEGYSIRLAPDPAGFEFWVLTLVARSSSVEGSSSTLNASSHAEGVSTSASGWGSHAEGYFTEATDQYTHAEGASTHSSAYASHAEGLDTTASSTAAHSEGTSTTASGFSSHAEGASTTADEYGAHAEGYISTAHGFASHAEGINAIATRPAEHAEASGIFEEEKAVQVSRLVLGGETINGSLKIGYNRLGGGATDLTLTDNRLSVIRMEVGAWRSSDDIASRWVISATASRVGSSVRLIAPATVNQTDHDSGANDWTVEINTNSSGLAVDVSANSGTVRWTAVAEIVEVA